MAKNKNYGFNEESYEEKSEEVIEVIEEKVEKPIVYSNKQKEEYTIIDIQKRTIYLTYTKNEVVYGVSIPSEDKYSNSKIGDVIYL